MLDGGDLARQIREASHGAEAQRIQRGTNEVRSMHASSRRRLSRRRPRALGSGSGRHGGAVRLFGGVFDDALGSTVAFDV